MRVIETTCDYIWRAWGTATATWARRRASSPRNVLLREAWTVAHSIRITVGSLALVAVVACGGNGDTRQPDAPSTSTTAETPTTDGGRSTSSTTTTLDEATDEAAVGRALQELAVRYDEAIAQILADPRVAGEADHPAVRAYTDLFVPGSDFAADALAAWAQLGAEGQFHRPGPRGQMYESTVAEVVVDRAARTANFSLCSLVSLEVVDAAGRPLSGEGGLTAATGVAELVGSEWRLRELTEVASDGCEADGATRVSP